MIRLLVLTFAAMIVAACQPKPFNATKIVASQQSAIEGEWQPRSSGTDTEFGTMTIADGKVSFSQGGEAKLSIYKKYPVGVLEWSDAPKHILDLCGGEPPNLVTFTLTDKDQILAADEPGQMLEARFVIERPTIAIYPPVANEELCRIATWER